MSLGSYLRSLREARRLTLRGIEKTVGVSNAYLSQLEKDKIRRPSLWCLYKLARLYKVSYRGLMKMVGYPVPETSENSGSDQQPAIVGSEDRFSSSATIGPFDDLTDEEEETLLEYLAFLRSRQSKKQNI